MPMAYKKIDNKKSILLVYLYVFNSYKVLYLRTDEKLCQIIKL